MAAAAGALLLVVSMGLASAGSGEGGNPAVNQRDRCAWERFIAINAAAKDGTNNALWETWASDLETFPAAPDRDNPPRWPGGPNVARRRKLLEPLRQIEILRKKLQLKGIKPLVRLAGGSMEVRRNRPAFDFIVGSRLYYREGITEALQTGRTLDFPTDSIEIKATWQPITEEQKPRYHWNVDPSGKLFGMKSLHLSTKDLPNWFWATFEHVDNPDRNKEQAPHDAFGVTPPNSSNGTVSPALEQLFAQAGLGPEWRFYRLDGTQVDFTDSTGRRTLLGNSDIEAPFMHTSSCITCHAKSAMDATGVSLDVFKSIEPVEGDVGTPDPNWFWDENGKRKTIQLDFVWAFDRANPAKK
jgi:hypothetical protein